MNAMNVSLSKLDFFVLRGTARQFESSFIVSLPHMGLCIQRSFQNLRMVFFVKIATQVSTLRTLLFYCTLMSSECF